MIEIQKVYLYVKNFEYLYMGVVQNALNRTITVGECMNKPVDVGELRVGGYMLIDGHPCRIVDIAKSKPCKHGIS